ncbi:UNVERIFIED_CONTAM: Mitotic spindle checkpoint protein MAD1 [Sesamum latifolium]|uniref:Mitotic spindle checkpoint protein MAD1 n=1 Tax=Sesamum latifolium TaxID=2727402 RepID=A0AAW2UYT2_9LAMI
MILRTPPPRKRRADSQPPEDINNNNAQSPSSNRELLVYEDLPVPEYSHDHSIPITSDQMLCTYQCRQMVKSEFFDALSSAEKQVHDYQSKFGALNEDLSNAEAERKKFREKFFNAEQELAAAKGREQMLQEQLRKEVDFSQEQLRKQIHSFSELEVKFQKEMDLRKKAESSAAQAEEKASLLEEKLSTLSESIDREKNRLQNELLQMRSESKLSVSRISADLERMECKATNAEKESAMLREQLEELKKRLDEIVMDDHQRPDGIPVTRFTLHSIYALSDDEKLQFEYESGNTNIVVNDYTSQPEISRQVDIFIRKMNSIPAFTSNLTVESFNKRTLS